MILFIRNSATAEGIMADHQHFHCVRGQGGVAYCEGVGRAPLEVILKYVGGVERREVDIGWWV